MQWQNNPYFAALLVAGLISFINALVIAQRRRVAASMPLYGAMLAACLWSLAYGFELASANLHWQVLWAKIEYLGITATPTFFLIFALEYADYRQKLKRWLYALWILPLACLLLVWTNELHGLIWSQVSQRTVNGLSLLSLTHGLAFWIWAAWSYLLLLSASILLVTKAVHNSSEFRQQAFLMVTGVLVTWAGNLAYLFGFNPLPGLDLTPISLVLSMFLFSIGLLRYGILDIMPIAGGTILESLNDIVIIVDGSGRIIYLNSAFEYYAHVNPDQLVGRLAADAFSPWPALRAMTDMQSTIRRELVVKFGQHDPFYFDTRVSTVKWNSQRVGRIFILADYTERRQAEMNLRMPPEAFDEAEPADPIPVVIVCQMPGEHIVECNRAFVLNLGYDRKEVIGRSLLSLGAWDHYQRVDFLRLLMREKSFENHPLTLKRKNGTDQVFSASVNWMELESESDVTVLAKPVRG